jgi:DnaJ-related protein SCJ1
VHVPLKDFYNGGEKEFQIEKQMICDACEGSGSADGHVETCSQCAGHGMVIQRHQIAPGMYQQMQTQCSKCGGKGKQVTHPCKTCGGQRVVRGKETYTVHIEKGVPKGARISYENEGEQSPDYEAGDLVVQLLEKDPQIWEDEAERFDGNFFRRKGKDLFWREVLSLREAWMGDWTRNVTHMDGHVVKLSRKRGQVVQPGLVEVVKGEGMPVWSEDSAENQEPGALNIEYVVVLPDKMDKSMEKEFWDVWDKHRRKAAIDLEKEQGRPKRKDEL